MLIGSGCTISPDKTSLNEQVKDSPEYVTITALELAQLKDAALQWQQARSGIERLLKLERELTYLVDNLDIINSKAIAQSNQAVSNRYARSSIKANTSPNLRYGNNYASTSDKVERPKQRYSNRYAKPTNRDDLQNQRYNSRYASVPKKMITAPSKSYSNRSVRSPVKAINPRMNKKVASKISKATKVAMVDTNKKVFALQVASLDSEESVAKQWKKINRKAAPLFRDKITTNVEKAKVNNKTYYRLKLGEYYNFKSAEDDCEVFKFYKVDCFVSNYTDKPIRL
ncbi:SPOR domain-containing protein [Pseudoalteromonas sp. DL-6]|uniref:SPOR domain-containing protein n=1 Tax=Pseudoalteromonas sp. DL-6 TaxID=1390185 RepID=UPI001039F0CC|nr:SPOR domain-containing protein [Pseudoalteromonas sp. DL-6]QBJ63546.1 SPOR domain-containing protein [Pseudoalteromonas sp. DL-6]